MDWVDYLRFGTIQVVVTFAAVYLASYLKTKGKNLATEEDIGKITREIESVKTEYLKELEGLKSQLNAKFHAHTVRYDKEFKAFEKIWTYLAKLKESTEDLPRIARLGTPDEERVHYLTAWSDSYNIFLRTLEAHRPFIPAYMYEPLRSFLASAAKYYVVHMQIQPEHLAKDEYRDQIERRTEELKDEINETTEKLFHAIQRRLKEYEDLS